VAKEERLLQDLKPNKAYILGSPREKLISNVEVWRRRRLMDRGGISREEGRCQGDDYCPAWDLTTIGVKFNNCPTSLGLSYSASGSALDESSLSCSKAICSWSTQNAGQFPLSMQRSVDLFDPSGARVASRRNSTKRPFGSAAVWYPGASKLLFTFSSP